MPQGVRAERVKVKIKSGQNLMTLLCLQQAQHDGSPRSAAVRLAVLAAGMSHAVWSHASQGQL